MNVPETLFESIEQDTRRGSRELVESLLNGLLEWASGSSASDVDLLELSSRIVELRPAMASLRNVGRLIFFRGFGSDDPSLPVDQFRKVIESIREEFNQSAERIQESFMNHFEDTEVALTFSRSGTVLDLLNSVTTLDEVIVLHSYPGGEGVDLLGDLRDELSVQFRYDAEASKAFDESDLFLMGCDQFTIDGDVCNKVGSELLARASGSTPVVVATTRFKWTDTIQLEHGPTIRSPGSLPASGRSQHPIFERVDGRYVDGYLLDSGYVTSLDDFSGGLDELRDARRQFQQRIEE